MSFAFKTNMYKAFFAMDSRTRTHTPIHMQTLTHVHPYIRKHVKLTHKQREETNKRNRDTETVSKRVRETAMLVFGFAYGRQNVRLSNIEHI